jgi:hypothetical protein
VSPKATEISLAETLPSFVTVTAVAPLLNVEPSGPAGAKLMALQLPNVSHAEHVAPVADTDTLSVPAETVCALAVFAVNVA